MLFLTAGVRPGWSAENNVWVWRVLLVGSMIGGSVLCIAIDVLEKQFWGT